MGGGSLAVPQHRPQKRFWSGSFAEREEEAAELKMAKHSLQQQSLRICQPSAAVREVLFTASSRGAQIYSISSVSDQ